MRLFKKKLSRAEAITKAIDISVPGDSIEVHDTECFDQTYCVCESKTLIVAGGQGNPVGFRMRNERP